MFTVADVAYVVVVVVDDVVVVAPSCHWSVIRLISVGIHEVLPELGCSRGKNEFVSAWEKS